MRRRREGARISDGRVKAQRALARSEEGEWLESLQCDTINSVRDTTAGRSSHSGHSALQPGPGQDEYSPWFIYKAL